MALRCFLFSSDEETTERLRQILLGIGVQAEFCSEAVVAVERITNQPYQVVIIDWDRQPEAGLLLTTARERKASERPITLAIVSDDLGVPRALQAGANSVLRKPIVAAQAKDTLTTARDLLHAKQGSAASTAAAAAAGSPSTPANFPGGQEKTLRAGDFLQSAPVTPGGQFETEPDASASPEQNSAAQVNPLKNLEPVVAPVAQNKAAEPQPAASNDGRGLEWYLRNRVAAASPATGPRGNPDLMGYDQATFSPPAEPEAVKPAPLPKLAPPAPPKPMPDPLSWQEQKKEAELFSYIESGSNPSDPAPQSGFRLGNRAIFVALLLAAFAVLAAPQAPWHSKMKTVWAKERQALHVWLNPQPVTPPQAPTAHETFYRAGDEYKLPVVENIPDATTDPSQIKVVPTVDPTVKKPNNDPNAPDPFVGQANTPVINQPQTPTSADSQPQSQPAVSAGVPSPAPPVVTPSTSEPKPAVSYPDPFTSSKAPASVSTPASPKPSQGNTVMLPGNVPSSLKSQLATMTPEASGNKLPEAALPSLEPVNVPESVERAQLTDQPIIAYPANVRGDQGAVVLQVLIGRDGTVQDVKFLQGSLAFARPAIDGVRQWKFKPFLMNGRPVSVQTQLTIKFKPGQ